jgi:hypothetical protein
MLNNKDKIGLFEPATMPLQEARWASGGLSRHRGGSTSGAKMAFGNI